jgi:hypothetical protein
MDAREKGLRDDIAVQARTDGDWQTPTAVLADFLEQERGDPAACAEAAALRSRLDRAAAPARQSDWPALAEDALTPHQVGAGNRALSCRLGVLIGGPGTGKTRVISSLVSGWPADLRHLLALCAPTGRAAVRMKESLDAADCPWRVEPRTIHQTLAIGRNGHDGRGWGFAFNDVNPLPWKYLIADEMSMGDANLVACLLQAVPRGGHVLLVGDTGQLPPVGHGAPLRDLIAAGVPTGELAEVHRNAGLIARTCAAVRRGEALPVPPRPDEVPNLVWVDRPARQAEEAAVDFHSRYEQAHCQVICATNAQRDKLNAALARRLNPGAHRDARRVAEPGDKVLCTANGWYPGPEGTQYVANGELGRCVEAPGGGGFAAAFGRRQVLTAHGQSRDSFALGYAITGHKCVHPDTLVETDQGLLPIRDIRPTGWTASHDGAKAYRNLVRNPIGPALTLTAEGGYSLTVTPEHKVERFTPDGLQLCRADGLALGDWLRLQLGTQVDAAAPCRLPGSPTADVRATAYPVPQCVTAELAEFLGLMVADGTVWGKGFRLLKRHADVAERFGLLATRLFGCRARRVSCGKAVGYEVSSSLLASWLQSLGGLSPNAKGVPDCILRSPLTCQLAFIMGLFEDATVNVRDGAADHIEFSSAAPRVAEIVQQVLLRAGIASRRTRRRNIWHVYIYGADAATYRDRIGFVSSMKQARLGVCLNTRRRQRIPIAREELRQMRRSMPHLLDEFTYQNARAAGYLSREKAGRLCDFDQSGILRQRLEWHWVRLLDAAKTECESMCVEVPDGHRFCQNGFPFGNSQGSQWDTTIVAADDGPAAARVCTREWWYTVLSRAAVTCYVVGPRDAVVRQCRRESTERRLTFLKELMEA